MIIIILHLPLLSRLMQLLWLLPCYGYSVYTVPNRVQQITICDDIAISIVTYAGCVCLVPGATNYVLSDGNNTNDQCVVDFVLLFYL